MSAILILGNGFDLDLGLKTRYSNFANSKQWDELYSRHPKEGNSLASYIFNLSEDKLWFDIEEGLANYVRHKEEMNDLSLAEDDKKFFEDLKKSLGAYLSEEFENGDRNENSLAAKFLKLQNENLFFDSVYSFNYTLYDTLPYMYGKGDIEGMGANYIHSCIDTDGHFVFGISEKDCNSAEYDFLKKVNQDYVPTNIYQDLANADEVVIFGHSLNRIDKIYFEGFFRLWSEDYLNRYEKRHVTIIGINSCREDIRRRLQQFDFNYTQFINSCNVQYIASDNYEYGLDSEVKRVNDLFKRLDNLKTK